VLDLIVNAPGWRPENLPVRHPLEMPGADNWALHQGHRPYQVFVGSGAWHHAKARRRQVDLVRAVVAALVASLSATCASVRFATRRSLAIASRAITRPAPHPQRTAR
jgi:hypothetical protein